MRGTVRLMVVGVAACILVTGCATTINVKNDLPFDPRENPIPKTAALYVAQHTQQFRREGGHSGGNCIIEFGKSIVPNAERSLSKVFSKVVVVNGSDPQSLAASGADYMIELKLNRDTEVLVGAMTFSAHKVTVSVKCIGTQVKDSSVVLQEDVTVVKEKRSAAGFIPIGWVATSGWQGAIQSASNEGVQDALEKVNDLILANREKFK